jgi:hypothetical protein
MYGNDHANHVVVFYRFYSDGLIKHQVATAETAPKTGPKM